MTDHELSGLLQEWKRTPAPPTLTGRVFDGRKTIAPRLWDRVPASVTALSGVTVGGLVVYGLLSLASPRTATQQAPQAVPVEAPVAAPVPEPKPPASEVPRRIPKASKPPRPTPFEAPPPKPADIPPTPLVTSAVPRVVSAPSAVFPPGAQALAVTTNVKLRIRIDKDGHVVDATVIDGDPVLNDAALEAVKGWVYRPYMLNGIVVEQSAEVVVNFTSGRPRVPR